jgi:hypothetical protein
MPDDLDAMLLRLRAQHSEPARQKWTSGLEARLNEKERDDDELHTKTIEHGGADGAGGNERDGSGAGRGAGTAADAQLKSAHDAGAEHAALSLQRTRASVVAAEAPPFVPGHLADRQRPPEVDPYSPDPSLYSPEWLAEFDRRCAEVIAQNWAAIAAIERARNGR